MREPSAFGRLADELQYSWELQARPEQRLPAGDWLYWLMLTGRGWGKSRTLSETVRQWIKDGFNYVNLIGATADDVRTILVEGPSGILACCPPSERPDYLRRSNELRWPSGQISLLFSAEEPDRLRGKQHEKLACDELAAWRAPDAWDQALLGLRLGRQPQAAIATTPRPTRIVRDLVKDPRTILTRGTTFDNSANLSAIFVEQVVSKFQGTRQGRQELLAEVLSDVPNATWTLEMIDRARQPVTLPDFKRVVVAVDPSGARSEDDTAADAIGIVVAGLGGNGMVYVLEDLTIRASPATWGKVAVAAYHRHRADRIVAERNFGGAMVEHVIRTTDPSAAFSEVVASRSKWVRAEPVSALYEQDKVRHAPGLDDLEVEMGMMTRNGFVGDGSPNRVDALVWAITELALGAGTGADGWLSYMSGEAAAARGDAPATPAAPARRSLYDTAREQGGRLEDL